MEQFDRAQMARRFADTLVAAESRTTEIMLPDGSSIIAQSRFDTAESQQDLARRAFDLADAMIAEENKRKSTNG